MGQLNWEELADGLSGSDLARGVTAGVTPPSGGGNYIFGFNTKTTAVGAAGLVDNQANFGPLRDDSANPRGGSIRGAIQRGASAGLTGFAPMLVIGLQNAVPYGSVNDMAYLLGLADSDPHAIVLRKGAISGGLDPTGSGVLRVSTATYEPGTWLHLRLDMIVNPNGDTVLVVMQNDLETNPVTAPVWEAIPGMDDYIDDALEINSGSAPYAGGFLGFGFYANGLSRRGYFDHLEVYRQR